MTRQHLACHSSNKKSVGLTILETQDKNMGVQNSTLEGYDVVGFWVKNIGGKILWWYPEVRFWPKGWFFQDTSQSTLFFPRKKRSEKVEAHFKMFATRHPRSTLDQRLETAKMQLHFWAPPRPLLIKNSVKLL